VADRGALDRWILARLTRVEGEVDALLEAFDATSAARRVMQFVDDDVSKWYVRLSRARFYDVDGADNRAAFATLHEVLTVTARLLAPFAPFISDWLHRSLTGGSVHLAAYVRESAARHRDDALEAAMADIRALAGLGHAARDTADVRVRQPLPSMQCVVPGDASALEALAPLLATELNVKRIEFVTSTDGLVSLEAKANFRVLGKKFGGITPQVAAAVGTLDDAALRTLAQGGSVEVMVADEAREITPEDVTILRRASGAAVVQEDGGYGVALDPSISAELRAEGMAREIVSRVQRLRRDAALEVSDRIRLAVAGDAEIEAVARSFATHIAGEVLATQVLVGGDEGSPYHDGVKENSWTARQEGDVDGRVLRLALTKDGA
jgi:isoleucyl-tRNA synthetase